MSASGQDGQHRRPAALAREPCLTDTASIWLAAILPRDFCEEQQQVLAVPHGRAAGRARGCIAALELDF